MQSRRRHLYILCAIVVLLAFYPMIFPQHLNLGISILLFAVLATSWDIVGGWTGQISLGHAAFVGMGAYTMTLLALGLGLAPWWGLGVALAASILLAVVWGWITFRLQGAYFTLSTIAVAEILRLVATNWRDVTGGAQGLFIFELPSLFGLSLFDRQVEFYLALALLAVTLFIVWWLSGSRFGYYLQAIREDEDAARALGINPLRYKLQAFMLSGAIAGAGGVLYAIYLSFFEPYGVFELELSVEIALMSFIGGSGTLFGPLIGSVILEGAGDVLRSAFGQANLLLYGILIVLVVRFAPTGVMGAAERVWRRWMRGSHRSDEGDQRRLRRPKSAP